MNMELLEYTLGLFVGGLLAPDNWIGSGIGVAICKVYLSLRKQSLSNDGHAFIAYGAVGGISNFLLTLATLPVIVSNYAHIGLVVSEGDYLRIYLLAVFHGIAIAGIIGVIIFRRSQNKLGREKKIERMKNSVIALLTAMDISSLPVSCTSNPGCALGNETVVTPRILIGLKRLCNRFLNFTW